MRFDKPFASFAILDDWPQKITYIEAFKSNQELKMPDIFQFNTFTRNGMDGRHTIEWGEDKRMTLEKFSSEYQRQISLAVENFKKMEAA